METQKIQGDQNNLKQTKKTATFDGCITFTILDYTLPKLYTGEKTTSLTIESGHSG